MDDELSRKKKRVCAGKAGWPINNWIGLRVASLLLLFIILLSTGCSSLGAKKQPVLRQLDIKEAIDALLLDTRGWLWVGTSQGVIVIQPDYTQRNLYLQGKDGKALRVSAIAEGGLEQIWLGTNDGAIKVGPGFDIQDSILRGQAVTTLLSDGKNMLWIGTKSGLYEYRGQGAVISIGINKNFFSDVQVNALALDPRGNLWIGMESGLASLDTRKGSGIKIYRTLNSSFHIPVKSLALESQERLWLGTREGLARPVGTGFWNEMYMKSGASFDSVNLLIVDRAGRVWVNTPTDGLHVLDRSGSELNLARPVELSGHVTALAMGKEGNIWVAWPGKLILFDSNAAIGQRDRALSGYLDAMKLILFWGLMFATAIWWFIRINFRSNRRTRALPEPTILGELDAQPIAATTNLTARAETIDTLFTTYCTGTPDERRHALKELEKRGQVEVF